MTQWFHAACLFEQMKNPRATKLEAVEDLEGLDELQDSDQQLIQDLFQKLGITVVFWLETCFHNVLCTILGEEPSASATPYKKKKAGDAGADLDEETPKSKKQKKGDAKEAANKPQKGKKVAAASDHSDEEKTPKAKASKKSVGGRKKKVTDKADD